jgi:hypothetical protein
MNSEMALRLGLSGMLEQTPLTNGRGVCSAGMFQLK